ncbi:hypothetical protein CPB86DRAFT_103664 [Serendipita vermifera]|nr:hypothetical protein CPB86DRAFT_103664 [Serendipita vermifera]
MREVGVACAAMSAGNHRRPLSAICSSLAFAWETRFRLLWFWSAIFNFSLMFSLGELFSLSDHPRLDVYSSKDVDSLLTLT